MMNETSQLMSETLKYQGKILKKEGEKNDKKWKLWKLSFESGMTYPWQVSVFEGVKGVAISDMVEGQYYEIVYKINEFQSTQHGLIKSKQGVLIKEGKEESNTMGSLGNKPVGSANISSNDTSSGKLEVRDWTEFQESYDKQAKDLPSYSAVHMLGAYMANKYLNETTDLVHKCNEHFKDK